jgi:putative ATP-dependent endonuclease of OLD family
MKIRSFEFSHIKSYRSLDFRLDRTSVLIGQNDHGKSSILKAIDIVLNQLNEDVVEEGTLHPDLAERLLPVFPVDAKARRIIINYYTGHQRRQLYITVRSNLTFVIHERIARNIKTTPAAVQTLKELREKNRFILIPALRDASSSNFQDMLARILKSRGLAAIIPKKAGGTPKEYRKLKSIRDDISEKIKPYIDEMLLPQIERNFGFKTEHSLAFKFDVDVQDIGQWILDRLKLGFQLTDDTDATIALSEAGTGVQSVVLLALHRLEHEASGNPNTQFILAVEEPEAFLHPQKQRELYQSMRSAQTDNLRIIVTTHSPYIVADTPFSKLGLVKRSEKYSELHTPFILHAHEEEIFDAYSSDINNLIFFADKVILVEGESDVRVLKLLLEKKYGASAHRISVISASGNLNFSPFLRMIKAWRPTNIPHLVVTDFDSLTAPNQRPIIRGIRDAGYNLPRES